MVRLLSISRGHAILRRAMRLLIIEDEIDLATALGTGLRREGYAVDTATSAAEAFERLMDAPYDVICLDLGLPDADGREVCRRLRAGELTPPDWTLPRVIMLTARDGLDDRVGGLDDGADDYLVKPFSLRELVARLRSVVRRTATDRLPRAGRRTAHFDDWTIDLSAHKAQSADRAVELTGGEVAILRALIERPQHVFTRAELLASTRHDDGEVFDRTVDVLISRLRRKLEDDPLHPQLIQTVRGEGYYFTREVTWQTHS
jgi:two-component system OmpR family response regulator